jgi:hypothetical protein
MILDSVNSLRHSRRRTYVIILPLIILPNKIGLLFLSLYISQGAEVNNYQLIIDDPRPLVPET